jgi:hypothetical protein
MARHGVVVLTCNPSSWEVNTGRLQVQGQPGLHSETLPYLKIITTTKTNHDFYVSQLVPC